MPFRIGIDGASIADTTDVLNATEQTVILLSCTPLDPDEPASPSHYVSSISLAISSLLIVGCRRPPFHD
jgi:hypothetical protein